MWRNQAGDRSSWLAAAFVVVVFLLLVVGAFFLASTQATQRQDLRARYVDRAVVATALVDSLFEVAFNGTRVRAEERLAEPRIAPRLLDAEASRGTARWTAVVDASGRVLGASRGTPSAAIAELRSRPAYVRAALGPKRFGLGDAGDDGTIESAIAFDSPSGPRVQVTGTPEQVFNTFLSGTLSPLARHQDARAFVVDGSSEVIAAIDRGGRPTRPSPHLLDALERHETQGTFERDGVQRFFTARPVPGSRWRLVVSVPESVLYAGVSGTGRWVPWAILGFAALALVWVALLLRKLIATGGALRRANRELAHSNAELERSNADLEQFAYVASHDLSEPLRTVAGFSQLLGRRYRGELDGDADLYIDHMTAGVDRMQQLIDDLLLYSRVGRAPAADEEVHLDQVLEEVRHAIDPTVRESGAEITHDRLPVVRGEAGQLRQLLQNLLVNAIKFTEPGVVPTIHVGASRNGGDWRVAVRDNGIGVDPAQREQIFKMFGRLHPADSYPGTGIGLALAKRIVESHGGHIWVEPAADGRGSVFVFTLPAPARVPEAAHEHEGATA